MEGERTLRTLEGYASGPDAPQRATAEAWARVDHADVVVIVEGISDQIAVETAAEGRGRLLDENGVVVVPIGGAHAIRGFLRALGRLGTPSRVACLCDRREEAICRDALAVVEHLGLFVCVDDLEDELIRAVGVARVQSLLESEGDLRSFRSLQNQPAWRGRELDAQLRRFLGSGARRKLRYARLLTREAVRRDAVPQPIDALLAAVLARRVSPTCEPAVRQADPASQVKKAVGDSRPDSDR